MIMPKLESKTRGVGEESKTLLRIKSLSKYICIYHVVRKGNIAKAESGDCNGELGVDACVSVLYICIYIYENRSSASDAGYTLFSSFSSCSVAHQP